MTVTRVPKKSLQSYLYSSMGYSGTEHWKTFALLKRGYRCYQQVTGSGHAHLPFFLVLDLRLLVEFGNAFTFSERHVAGFDPQVRALYENQILNRLLREFCVQQALELLSFFKIKRLESDSDKPDEVFSPRADRLTMLLVERLSPYWPRTIVVNAANLRGLSLDIPDDDMIWESLQALELSSALTAHLETFVHAATGSTVGVSPMSWSETIKAEDLFELEHFEALNREYLRRQVRRLIEVRESMEVLDPHDINLQEEISEVETLFMDQSHYPTGGFSEITTRGSFENLVLSELIYMGRGALLDESSVVGGEGSLDLFDLRFVEGELLYYLRDSGHLQRKRRQLDLIIDLRNPLNIKYPDHPYQLETLVMGLVMALERDIRVLFAVDAVTYKLHLVCDREEKTTKFPEHVQKLKAVLDILFSASIQRELMSVVIEAETDWGALPQRGKKSYCIGLSNNPETVADWSSLLEEARHRSPPLFGVVVSLADGELLTNETSTLVLSLNLAGATLDKLKLKILEAILKSSAPIAQRLD